MAKRKSSNSLDGWIDESVPGEPSHPLFVIDPLLVGTTLPVPPPRPPAKTLSPLRALLKRHSVDANPFIQWLRPNLSWYRDEMRLREQMPTPAEEREFLLDLSHRASELCRLLKDLPPRTRVALRPGHEHVPDLKRLSDDSLLLDRLCRHGEAVLRASPARRGRKRANHRNVLLKAVRDCLKKAEVDPKKSLDLAGEPTLGCGERVGGWARPRRPAQLLRALDRINGSLDADHFYSDAHRLIFATRPYGCRGRGRAGVLRTPGAAMTFRAAGNPPARDHT